MFAGNWWRREGVGVTDETGNQISRFRKKQRTKLKKRKTNLHLRVYNCVRSLQVVFSRFTAFLASAKTSSMLNVHGK